MAKMERLTLADITAEAVSLLRKTQDSLKLVQDGLRLEIMRIDILIDDIDLKLAKMKEENNR